MPDNQERYKRSMRNQRPVARPAAPRQSAYHQSAPRPRAHRSSSYDDLAQYRAANYSHRKPRRSKAPFAIAALLFIAVAVGAGVAFSGVLSPRDAGTFVTADAAGTSMAVNEAAAAKGAENVVMTLGGSQDTYVLKGEEYLEAGCHAVDKQKGDITSSVKASGKVDTSKVGDYKVTYTATAADGAVATKERTVHVVDSFDENATSLPVFMYHYVYSAGDAPEELNGNYILDTDLAVQLGYVSEHGYYYPSYQEIRAFAEGKHTLPAKSCVFTFDDCEAGFLKYGVPLLNEYKVPATSFVICSDGDASEKILNNASEYVQFQSHSFDMHKAGSNVGRGGVIHAMTQEEILSDLKQAQGILGSTEAFAYPFGDNNETAQAALAQAGILCAFTINNDRVYPGDNPYALNRVRISGEYTLESFANLVAPNA